MFAHLDTKSRDVVRRFLRAKLNQYEVRSITSVGSFYKKEIVRILLDDDVVFTGALQNALRDVVDSFDVLRFDNAVQVINAYVWGRFDVVKR